MTRTSGSLPAPPGDGARTAVVILHVSLGRPRPAGHRPVHLSDNGAGPRRLTKHRIECRLQSSHCGEACSIGKMADLPVSIAGLRALVSLRIPSSKCYIWELENKNPPRPSADKVTKIAAALGVTSDYLLWGERE